ncbi:MAG: phosphatidylserine/phosphatidylglycerophosphate/cardiolipin synthase-like enzyme [Myxococcota bacterium]|jgi:phosphatidylserine/phosphatidylglycerophosphate/cardiolipin synthase-like enzyme
MIRLLPFVLFAACNPPNGANTGDTQADTHINGPRDPGVPAAWDQSTSIRTSDGAFELFFTRPGVERGDEEDPELDDAVIALIDAATRTIDASLFEFNRVPIVASLLRAHDRGVAIRFVGDGDELHDPGYEALVEVGVVLSVRAPNDRIMHNKFVLIDDTTLFTGSTNFSRNGVMLNNNGSLIVSDPIMAAAYAAEFEQMYSQGLFGRRKESVNPPTRSPIGDHIVTPRFSPADPANLALLDTLAEADIAVLFMVFSFTREDIIRELIDLHNSGIQVVGVFDESQARSRYSADDILAEAGVPVFIDGNHNAIGFAGGKLHHKAMIVDPLSESEPTTIVGSYNWSASANEYNDENLLVIEGAEVASAYMDEFCRVLAVATPHPLYKGTVPDPCAGLLIPIRFNEVFANPEGTDRGNEWVEIVNAGGAPVDLDGWTLGDVYSASRHVFEPFILPPGASLVIAESSTGATREVLVSSGTLSLNNNAEELTLYDASGTTVDHIGYQNAVSGVSFNRFPDGNLRGDFALHTELPGAVGASSAGNLASGEEWGVEIVLNEAMPAPESGGDEWVELVNVGTAEIDLSGWTLSDNGGSGNVLFPQGFILPGGRAVVLADVGADLSVFPGSVWQASSRLSLNNSNETITLYDSFGLERAQMGWGTRTSADGGISVNRTTDGYRNSALINHDQVENPNVPVELRPTSSPGLRVDGAAWGGEIVVNEVLPNPEGRDTDEEFIEIVNVGNLTVDLSSWTLGDAVNPRRHIFDDDSLLPPGAFVVVYDGGDHDEVTGAINATSGSLALNNTGDSATLFNSSHEVVSSVQWSSSTSGVSWNRSVDGDPGSDLTLHTDVGDDNTSPGDFAQPVVP